MGSLADIVSIQITTQTAAAKRAGFGVPLIVGAHSRFAEVVRSYSDPADMLTDGFLATDPEYLAASKLVAQNPRPSNFKIGRRASLPTPQAKLTPTAINSKLYRVNLDGVAAEFTSDATAAVAEITAGLKSAIDALAPAAWVKSTAYAVGDKVSNSGRKYQCTTAGTSAGAGGPTTQAGSITDGTVVWKYLGGVPAVVDATTYLTATAANAGDWFRLEVDDDPATAGHAGLKVEWPHADPGLSADLDAIKAADPDFYGVMLTTCGKAEITAAAAWIETNKRIGVQASSETAIITTVLAGATDIAATLKTNNEFRTGIIFHNDPGEFADAAWLGSRLPLDAGTEDWKFAQLAGVSADKLSATHIANLKAKNGNGFADYGGIAITFEGVTAAGEFLDVIRGRDALESDMQANVYTALVNAARGGKTPFTNRGIATVEGQTRASLQKFERREFLAPGETTVTVPDALEVSSADRAARKLTGITFSARLAGAVHAVELKGTITV
jgi:hypothetical protein